MAARSAQLFRNLLVYGAGDVATSAVSLLLLPVFIRHLTPAEYGVISMLLSVEAVTKVLFRWGVDTAFMRLFYDAQTDAAKQRLASTIFFFLLSTNGLLLVAGAMVGAPLARTLLGPDQSAALIVLTMANTFVAGFFFIPFQVMRITGASRSFVKFNATRSALTVAGRLVLVLWADLGVLGIVLADVIATTIMALALARWYGPLLRPVFAGDVLRDALAFGLPRIPHSVAHQVMGFADRYFLKFFWGLRELGVYSIGATFGLALKLCLSAFETAWTPFFLSVMRAPDAPRLYGTTSTYIVAALAAPVISVCAAAPDLLRLFTTPDYYQAAQVTRWIAVGVFFQGLYLVGSIGLVITKRTGYYPMATGLAAATSVLANLVLVPSYGLLGAAWANVLAYATLAIATSAFSYKVYPIPYEWGRLSNVAAAAILAGFAGTYGVPALPAIPGIAARTALTLAVYAAVLYATGFFKSGELEALRRLRELFRARPPAASVPAEHNDVEMAGEIVATPVDLPIEGPPSPGRGVSRDSRDRDR